MLQSNSERLRAWQTLVPYNRQRLISSLKNIFFKKLFWYQIDVIGPLARIVFFGSHQLLAPGMVSADEPITGLETSCSTWRSGNPRRLAFGPVKPLVFQRVILTQEAAHPFLAQICESLLWSC